MINCFFCDNFVSIFIFFYFSSFNRPLTIGSYSNFLNNHITILISVLFFFYSIFLSSFRINIFLYNYIISVSIFFVLYLFNSLPLNAIFVNISFFYFVHFLPFRISLHSYHITFFIFEPFSLNYRLSIFCFRFLSIYRFRFFKLCTAYCQPTMFVHKHVHIFTENSRILIIDYFLRSNYFPSQFIYHNHLIYFNFFFNPLPCFGVFSFDKLFYFTNLYFLAG